MEVSSGGTTFDVLSPQTITIAPKQVTLSATFLKLTTTTGTIGITDSGNFPAIGPLTFAVEASPDGMASDARLLEDVTQKENIKPTKRHVLTFKVTGANGQDIVLVVDPNHTFPNLTNPGTVFVSSVPAPAK